MKDTDLLLTDDERTVAWNEGVESGRMDWIWAGAEAVVRAQAAKVLAVLIRVTPHRDFKGVWDSSTGQAVCALGCAACGLAVVVNDTGLTWPPKEG